ncbi:MAG: hypothetical protein QOI38_2914 [Sphingomonadales bacterium]|nr:hypothetical protein [Sphingomonadales bacterium]
MPAFRYRTLLMVGPWRATRRDALADAVRCGLARWAGEPWDRVTWRFPGEIEEREEDAPDAPASGAGA